MKTRLCHACAHIKHTAAAADWSSAPRCLLPCSALHGYWRQRCQRFSPPGAPHRACAPHRANSCPVIRCSGEQLCRQLLMRCIERCSEPNNCCSHFLPHENVAFPFNTSQHLFNAPGMICALGRRRAVYSFKLLPPCMNIRVVGCNRACVHIGTVQNTLSCIHLEQSRWPPTRGVIKL